MILQVVYLCRALKKAWKLSSYRSEAGSEVDLIVEREDDLVAIEVKCGHNVAKTDTRGLPSADRGQRSASQRIAAPWLRPSTVWSAVPAAIPVSS